MRAMILAAGLGTRLRPLTELRAKPALPVRGRPVISLLLALLAKSGVREVLINLHHLPDSIREAVEADHPEGLRVEWSVEPEPLGTGGGLHRAARFLRESEDCVVMAGDMLLDLDLEALRARHHAAGRDVTIVLRDDPRAERFGSIGLDDRGRVLRVGRTPVRLPGSPKPPREHAAGLFTGVRFFRREALDAWPHAAPSVFEDLRDWLIPRAEAGDIVFGGEIVTRENSVWEPVGTPGEYLTTNLHPPSLPRQGGAAAQWERGIEYDAKRQTVSARSATIPGDATLSRCVVWEDERVPAGFAGSEGVFAGDAFHPCYEGGVGGTE